MAELIEIGEQQERVILFAASKAVGESVQQPLTRRSPWRSFGSL